MAFLVLAIFLAFFVLDVCHREVRLLEGAGCFALFAVEVCIGDGGSMDMMPSFCSTCSPSGKEENLNGLLFSLKLRL